MLMERNDTEQNRGQCAATAQRTGFARDVHVALGVLRHLLDKVGQKGVLRGGYKRVVPGAARRAATCVGRGKVRRALERGYPSMLSLRRGLGRTRGPCCRAVGKTDRRRVVNNHQVGTLAGGVGRKEG